MAECQGDIVYRKDRNACCSSAVADDNSALVKAYESALKSFQKELKSEGEESGDGVNEKSESEEPSKGPEKEGTATLQWAVGSQCRAVWSGDGLLYPGVLISLEGERGRVKFDGYGNEEDVELSALLPEQADQPQREKQQWESGCRCRAVWSEDGLVYPAVLVWKEGERGRVQFEGYGNEQEVELSALLPVEECGSRAETVTPVKVLREGTANGRNDSSSTDRREGEKESPSKKQDSAVILPPACTASGRRARGGCRSESGRGQRELRRAGCCEGGQMGACAPATPPYNFFPPVPPTVPMQGGLPSSPPPLPRVCPPWAGPGEPYEVLEDAGVSALSSMLLSWYLCGYHTGSYMAMQQSRAPHESADTETRRPSSSL